MHDKWHTSSILNRLVGPRHPVLLNERQSPPPSNTISQRINNVDNTRTSHQTANFFFLFHFSFYKLTKKQDLPLLRSGILLKLTLFQHIGVVRLVVYQAIQDRVSGQVNKTQPQQLHSAVNATSPVTVYLCTKIHQSSCVVTFLTMKSCEYRGVVRHRQWITMKYWYRGD
jgi:hypothetical protein